MHIRTVLCPIDFSALDPVELEVALEVCRTFEARLVVHHNLAAAHPGFSRVWEWERAHRRELDGQAETERRLRTIVKRAGCQVRAEGMITVGPVCTVVLAVAEQVGADLIVLGSHGWSTQDHASVSERMIDESPCPVLTFQEQVGMPPFRLRAEDGAPLRAVVPTDLTRASTPAVAYACALARILPLQLDLLHVMDAGPVSSEKERHAQAALDALVPADLVGAVSAHLRVGPAAAAIVEYVAAVQPAVAFLGEHAHGLLRRIFTRDTTREVMHRVECPVWVVPPKVSV